MHALAASVSDRGHVHVCPVLDALKQEVYAAVFLERDGQLERLQAEAAWHPRDWADHLVAEKGSYLFVGTGAQRYREVFTLALGERAHLPDDENLHRVKASALGRLAQIRLANGEEDDPRTLEPNYCRLSEAELASRRGPD